MAETGSTQDAPTVWYLLGASGTGKSTRARELVAELGPAVYVISTDVIRAQLRAVLDREREPDLWAESFDVPLIGNDEGELLDGVNINGFLRQCRPVLRAVEAAVTYCLTEGWNCIVEGVHLVPGEFSLAAVAGVEVHAELRLVEDYAAHRELFVAREVASAGGRPAAHYHTNLARIRTVQGLIHERWLSWDALPGQRARIEHVTPRVGER